MPVFIKEDYLRNMEIADPFFDSLRDDYEDFDGWFQKKQGEGKKAFIIRNKDRQVTSFLMLKEEAADDDDDTFLKKLPQVKRLKVSTFKVTDKGKRIGETFIKIMMRFAIQKEVGIIYVTIFPKQEQLISVLSEYGFKLYTKKTTKNAKGQYLMENVYVKDMSETNYFPNIEYTDQRVFLVPIRPEFNKLLFPESEINPQLTIDDLGGDITSANAIKKAYICNSNTKQIRAGDLLFFYSTRENMRLTAIGVVDIVYNSFENFDEIKNGIKSSVDFIRGELKLNSLKYLPYPAMLVSLVKFFGTTKKGGAAFTDLQRQSLIKWFWRSCFSRRYSSGVNSAHETDLQAMERLVFDEQYDICSFKCEVSPTFFTDNVFNLNTVNTKTFVALLASTSPKSFISGANVNLSEPMKLANSKEFHHIFPAKYLQRLGLARNRIFCLANFCFLNNADNQRIKDKAPAEYCKMMNSDKINDILQSALCPSQTFCLDYDTFLNERSKILVDQAKVLCGMAG